MINDVKSFMETIEKMNGTYQETMVKLGLDPEYQTMFFEDVRKVFDSKLDGFQGDPVQLYSTIINQGFYEIRKSHRNFVNKYNRKIIRNRGNVIHNSKNGTYRKPNEDTKS